MKRASSHHEVCLASFEEGFDMEPVWQLDPQWTLNLARSALA